MLVLSMVPRYRLTTPSKKQLQILRVGLYVQDRRTDVIISITRQIEFEHRQNKQYGTRANVCRVLLLRAYD